VPAVDRPADYEQRLPNATLQLVDDNHQLLFTRWREILEDVSRATS